MVTEQYRKRGGGFKMVNAENKQRTNIRTRKPRKNKLKQRAESHKQWFEKAFPKKKIK